MVIRHDIDEPVSIAVFARAPLPGQAKTRLLPALGVQETADLQTAFILRAVQTARKAGIGPVSLWCAPDCRHPVFEQCRNDFAVTLHAQCPGDLGARMQHALARLCRRGPALLIGVDCPALKPEHLLRAAQCLREGDDAVLLPVEDGGYVLIGLRRPEPRLFERMPWSKAELMEQTRRTMERLQWRWRELALLWDVDDAADLERLKSSGLMGDWFAGMAMQQGAAT